MKISFVSIVCATVFGVMALNSPAFAQEKTEKACADEWKANREANQKAKITEKAYVTKCRADSAAKPAAPMAAPAKPAAPMAAPAKPAAPMAAPAKPAAPMAAPAKPTGANQYSTEILAKAHCPTQTVVWANTDSKIYHFAGHKDYGHTKQGAYMCEKDATASGIRAPKDEKHP